MLGALGGAGGGIGERDVVRELRRKLERVTRIQVL
jgi:hypothetical protein